MKNREYDVESCCENIYKIRNDTFIFINLEKKI